MRRPHRIFAVLLLTGRVLAGDLASIAPSVNLPTEMTIFDYRLPAEGVEFLQQPVTMPVFYVRSAPEKTNLELVESMAHENLLAPCALFTWELRAQQVQALDAPIAPVPGESRTSQHQARFPLISLAW